MAVALLVEGDGLALQRVLGQSRGRSADPAAVAASTARSSAPECGARVAARAHRQQLDRLVADLGAGRDPALAILERPADQLPDIRRHRARAARRSAPAEQGRVDLEVGVLGRRADQRHQPLLHRGQERILLGLVEAVDLVEEEDRRLPRGPAALAGSLDHGAHLSPAGVDRRLLLERSMRGAGDDPRQRRLARSPAARREPSSAARLSRSPCAGSIRAEQMLLSDELVERRAGACAPPAVRRRRAPPSARSRAATPNRRTTSPSAQYEPAERQQTSACDRSHRSAQRRYAASMQEVGQLTASRLGDEAVELSVRARSAQHRQPARQRAPCPGAARRAAARAGFECRAARSRATAANLVARLGGAADGPTLCLLGHVDTVPADASDGASTLGRATSSTARFEAAAPRT